MASHLSRDPFELAVWNRTATKAEAFAKEYQARVASSPADAARDAEFVITCVPSSRELEEILGGENGIEAGISAGAMLIDCTSGDPATSRRVAARLQQRDIEFIDAPVSGGVKGAVAGTLTVMCGGTSSAVARAKPVLDAFGGVSPD